MPDITWKKIYRPRLHSKNAAASYFRWPLKVKCADLSLFQLSSLTPSRDLNFDWYCLLVATVKFVTWSKQTCYCSDYMQAKDLHIIIHRWYHITISSLAKINFLLLFKFCCKTFINLTNFIITTIIPNKFTIKAYFMVDLRKLAWYWSIFCKFNQK